VILIDDANAFDGTHDYPTIGWIESTARNAGYSVSLSQNIIQLAAQGLAPVDLPDSLEEPSRNRAATSLCAS
jgi:hypothetical protein